MIAEYSVTLENKTKTELILFIKELQDMLKEKDELYHKALGDLVKADRENITKDKQIDLMAEMIDELSEYYTRYWGKNNKFCKEDCIKKDIDCKDCIKQYFEKITKEKK